MISSIKLYGDLIRIQRPTGIILLFIPCTWGLILGAKGMPDFKGLVLFWLGAFCMRSAGCIYNDWVDRSFDRHVRRSQTRPLAARTLTSRHAFALLLVFLGLSFIIFLMLPPLTQKITWIALILVACYPWMKRITRWPQGVLGLAYTMGLPMGYSFYQQNLPLNLALLYAAGLVWTIFYDTLYAHQDLEDDLKLGLKSTTQIWPNHPKAFLILCHGLCLVLMLSFHKSLASSLGSYAWIILAFVWMFVLLIKLDVKNSQSCLDLFRKSTWLGWAVMFSLLWDLLVIQK